MGLTQGELAKKLGLSRPYVCQLISRGMPGDDIDAARQWVRQNLTPRARASGATSADLVAARVRLIDEQRLEVALRNAKTRRELVPTSLLAEILATVSATLAERLDALPAHLRLRCPALPPEVLEQVAVAISDMRNEAADAVERAGRQVLESGTWAPGLADEDEESLDDDDAA